MFYYRLDLPQVKRYLISSVKGNVTALPQEFLEN